MLTASDPVFPGQRLLRYAIRDSNPEPAEKPDELGGDFQMFLEVRRFAR